MRKTIITSIIGLVAIIGIALGFVPSLSGASMCSECYADNLSGLKRAFEAFYDNCRKQLPDGGFQKQTCYASNTYNKVLPIMKALSRDNRFGPANRTILVGDIQTGNLQAGASRSFQTVAPLDKQTLNLEINKTSGGGGAIVRVCSIDETGSLKPLTAIKVEETDETTSRSTTLNDVQGKMIRIDIAGIGGAQKIFQYTVKTN
jgi:hypothetical protein